MVAIEFFLEIIVQTTRPEPRVFDLTEAAFRVYFPIWIAPLISTITA